MLKHRTIAEVRRILVELDTEAVREEFIATVGKPKSPTAILASLHKARVAAPEKLGITAEQKLASIAWLAGHGYNTDIT